MLSEDLLNVETASLERQQQSKMKKRKKVLDF